MIAWYLHRRTSETDRARYPGAIMVRRGSHAALQLSAVAAVAVLVGHWIGYVVAVPDARLRDTILLDSGHSYWLLAVKLSLLLGVASLVASGLDAVRRGLNAAGAPEGWRLTQAFASLAVIQVAAFTTLEVGERVLAGEPVAHLFHHHVFAWGVVAQLLIAPLGAILLAWWGRALRRVTARAASARPTPGRSTAVAWPNLQTFVSTRYRRGPVAVRGPPAGAHR